MPLYIPANNQLGILEIPDPSTPYPELHPILDVELSSIYHLHLSQVAVLSFAEEMSPRTLCKIEAAAMLNGLSTNAGLFANAIDLGKYCQMLLNRGTYGGETYFGEATVEEFTKYQFPDLGNRRGLGFDKPPLGDKMSYVAKSASPSSFGHSGFTGTFFWVDPDLEMVFILLTNRVYPTRSSTQIYRLNLRPRMHQAIYDFLDKK